MVGVPGRSRACQSCKQRRIACDLKQPECSRCTKANRTCEYTQGHIFVVNEKGSHKAMYRKSLSKDNFPHPEENRNAGLVRYRSSSEEDVTTNGSLVLCNAPPLGPSIQEALLAHAVAEAASSGSVFTKLIANSITTGVFGGLFNAPLACYTIWRGRQDDNSALIDASRQLYVRGLVQAQKAVINPESARTDAALATVNALSVYEAIECPGQSMAGYNWHREACVRLIRLRGPEYHRDGFGHQLFLSLRLHVVLDSFEKGQSCYLSSPEWMTVPWEIHPKTMFDELVDIFMVGPAIMEQANRIPTIPPDQILAHAFKIVKDLFDIDQRLQDFYARLETRYPKPLYWESISPGRIDAFPDINMDSSELTFPPALAFHDLDLASILSLYWAILTMTWSGLSDISGLFLENGVPFELMASIGGPTHLTPETMEFLWLDRARKVCQSIAFCTSADALDEGPPRITVALNLILGVMRDKKICKPEYEWALRARKRFGNKWVRLMHVSP